MGDIPSITRTIDIVDFHEITGTVEYAIKHPDLRDVNATLQASVIADPLRKPSGEDPPARSVVQYLPGFSPYAETIGSNYRRRVSVFKALYLGVGIELSPVFVLGCNDRRTTAVVCVRITEWTGRAHQTLTVKAIVVVGRIIVIVDSGSRAVLGRVLGTTSNYRKARQGPANAK